MRTTLTPEHPLFPPALKRVRWTQARHCPSQLFVASSTELDLKLLRHRPTIAIVGSREMDDYGRRLTRTLVEALADQKDMNTLIVAGVCEGVDQTAHEAALEYGLPTIGVLPYLQHDKLQILQTRILNAGGLLISEYERQDGRPLSPLYLHRNRITAALSDAVCLVQCERQSGTLSTARHAIALNVPLLCPRLQQEGVNANRSLYEGLLDFVKEGLITRFWFTGDTLSPLTSLLQAANNPETVIEEEEEEEL